MLILGKKSEYTIHYTCIDVKLKWICIENKNLTVDFKQWKSIHASFKKKSNFKINLLPKN